MKHKLRDGGVLPFGLMGLDSQSMLSGFNKTYKNFGLRAGIVVKSYSIDNDQNLSKLAPEYDVVVIEQDSNRAITPITYRNCISANSFGSISDYFEARLRSQKTIDNKQTQGKDFSGQDGAIVLLLCLDGSSEKAVIIGALNHPDRKTKLVGEEKVLSGEFNGLSISVADDGSANLTFKGATDNKGKPLDSSQGNTTVDIEKDGSVQLKHAGVTARVQKDGDVSLNNIGSTLISSKKDVTIKTEAKFNMNATSDAAMAMNKLAIDAQGSATLNAQEVSITGSSKMNLKSKMIDIQGDSMVKVKSAQITLDGLAFLGGAGGQPLLLPTTQMIGIGNLGIPVLSTAIGPFTVKTFAT